MIGIGIDLCEIARMERILESNPGFLRRYFSEAEQAYIQSRGNSAAQSMAALYAAKEALLKAMGIGINGQVALNEIAVHHAQGGQPTYALTGAAQAKLAALGGVRAHLSLSHEAGVAAAVAMIE